MKYWYVGAALVALAAGAVLLLGGRKTSGDPPVDGGIRHRVDTDAPKVILSGEITEFSCKFSTTDRCVEDTPIAGGIFTLYAGEKTGCLQIRGRDEIAGEWTFSTDETFFRQLQEIVTRYDLAQYNGQYYTVSGLPPDLGMQLQIRYASEESISASNNQSTFLPPEAMEDLVTLFRSKINRSGEM